MTRNQAERMAELLRAGPLTTDQARQAGINRPAKVVARLRAQGFPIATVRPDGREAVYVAVVKAAA